MSSYDNFRSHVTPCEFGRAKVSAVIPEGAGSMIARLHGEDIRDGEPITSLHVGGRLVMSDTRDEWRDHITAIHMAHGRVLINGLGLGCYLQAILSKPDVSSVDVVEIEADVIALIGPHFEADDRVHFHEGDAYTFKFPAGTSWDVAWHDIWADKCTDDLEKHAKLLRRYGRRVGWQACWAHEWLLHQRRRDRSMGWAWA